MFSALGVARSQNILHSAFSLMGTLAGGGRALLPARRRLRGVVQLLVYVGGILVLILFAVLLTRDITDIKVSNLSVSLLRRFPAALLVLGLVLQDHGHGALQGHRGRGRAHGAAASATRCCASTCSPSRSPRWSC